MSASTRTYGRTGRLPGGDRRGAVRLPRSRADAAAHGGDGADAAPAGPPDAGTEGRVEDPVAASRSQPGPRGPAAPRALHRSAPHPRSEAAARRLQAVDAGDGRPGQVPGDGA